VLARSLAAMPCLDPRGCVCFITALLPSLMASCRCLQLCRRRRLIGTVNNNESRCHRWCRSVLFAYSLAAMPCLDPRGCVRLFTALLPSLMTSRRRL